MFKTARKLMRITRFAGKPEDLDDETVLYDPLCSLER
jgi:hypothetical protein